MDVSDDAIEHTGYKVPLSDAVDLISGGCLRSTGREHVPMICSGMSSEYTVMRLLLLYASYTWYDV